MIAIRPVSDLRNKFTDIENTVNTGEPVFLTKNGRGKYAILDIREYEQLHAELKLLSELEKGEKSAREKGWLSLSEVEKELGL